MTDISTKVMELLDANCLTDTDSDVATFSVAGLIGDITALVEKAERERDAARRIIVECVNRGTDGGASEDCSMEFLSHAPAECEAVKRQRDEARARTLEDAAAFVEASQSRFYSDGVNESFRANAAAIRQLKDREP